ncbi:hypothetical protein K0M31_007628 [Melipona bicolor]|uniref:Uncharacterized protein n=1 Tax=Melipona bicolor TaxID=60889 RepID=A0AA40GC28_9HYME|nr:hypothetical protein K0M31_007628 [Melipona bicolor]
MASTYVVRLGPTFTRLESSEHSDSFEQSKFFAISSHSQLASPLVSRLMGNLYENSKNRSSLKTRVPLQSGWNRVRIRLAAPNPRKRDRCDPCVTLPLSSPSPRDENRVNGHEVGQTKRLLRFLSFSLWPGIARRTAETERGGNKDDLCGGTALRTRPICIQLSAESSKRTSHAKCLYNVGR